LAPPKAFSRFPVFVLLETDFNEDSNMRVLFFLSALAVVGLVITGAIKFQKSDQTISIQIDRERTHDEAERVVEEGRTILQEAEASLNSGAANNVQK
jgi:hypothetical protein